MLVIMKERATPAEIEGVVSGMEQKGCIGRLIPGGERVAICVLHNDGPVDASALLQLPGGRDAISVTRPYKLASREARVWDSDVGRLVVGNGHVTIIAGPCATESEMQALAILRIVKKAGAQILRGSAYKPRNSPYGFQGLGEKGLKTLAKVRRETMKPVVAEATDHVVEDYTDIVEIGARNTQKFSLPRCVGKSRKPVLLTGSCGAHRGVAYGDRVCDVGRKRPRDPLRARGSHLRSPQPQCLGSFRHSCPQAGEAFAQWR